MLADETSVHWPHTSSKEWVAIVDPDPIVDHGLVTINVFDKVLAN